MMTLNNEVDVIELMNKRLPSYAVKCLLVAGFDATDDKVPRKGPDLTLPSRDKHTTLQAEAHSISSVKDQVRKSINRWVKEQPPGMLKCG